MRLSLATILCPKITRRNCTVTCAFALVWMFGGTSCKNDVVHSGITDSELEKFRGSAAVESLLSGMTLDDKVGEMTQLTLNMLCEGELSEKPGVYVVLDEPHALDESKLHAVCFRPKHGARQEQRKLRVFHSALLHKAYSRSAESFLPPCRPMSFQTTGIPQQLNRETSQARNL